MIDLSHIRFGLRSLAANQRPKHPLKLGGATSNSITIPPRSKSRIPGLPSLAPGTMPYVYTWLDDLSTFLHNCTESGESFEIVGDSPDVKSQDPVYKPRPLETHGI